MLFLFWILEYTVNCTVLMLGILLYTLIIGGRRTYTFTNYTLHTQCTQYTRILHSTHAFYTVHTPCRVCSLFERYIRQLIWTRRVGYTPPTSHTCTEESRFIINLFNPWSYACLHLTFAARAVVYLTFEHALLHQMLNVCPPLETLTAQ